MEVLERALEIGEREYGSAHKEVSCTIASLADAYVALGDAARAKELLERSLAIGERESRGGCAPGPVGRWLRTG